MEITFTCPHCHEVTLIGEEFAGQSGECRACGRMVTVTRLFSKENSGVNPLAVTGAFLRWCNRYLGYLLLGIFAVGVLTVLLAPELDDSRLTSRRMSSGNNLKQIALGIQNYYSTYKQLPRAYWLTPDGKRTLSWRVAIAPFTEHRAIDWRYDANESWDSDKNKVLAELKEPIYQQPGYSDGDKALQTFYMVITGPGTLFEEGKDITFDDCIDGLSNTILAVEVLNSGVHWAEPKDLDIRTMIFKINAGGSNGIGAPWKSGANVAFADGSVRLLSKDLLESTLRAMITRNGGEAIESPE
jgi:prepilin-type processing-associated H-X9-DG protein